MKRSEFLKLIGMASITPGQWLPGLQNENPEEENSVPREMPILFLGHGSPMNAIEENQFVRKFRSVAQNLPKPKAILCISAHYYTRGTKFTAMERPKTIHDFGGFPQELYQVQYPAPGLPSLAQKSVQLLSPFKSELDANWGLDHGAWSVLKHFFPKADIPVVMMSLDYTKSTQEHYTLAQELKELRKQGVLIVGSGNLIHNLGLIDFKNFNKPNYGFDWAQESYSILKAAISEKDHKKLIRYDQLNKSVQLAIPSPDHYLPLIYILALQNKNEQAQFFNEEFVAGSLNMASVMFGV